VLLHREYFTYPLQHLKDLKRTKKQKMKDIIKVSVCSFHTQRPARNMVGMGQHDISWANPLLCIKDPH
jgi:hypothetical protein